MHDDVLELQQSTRRAFFSDAGLSVGALGLASLLGAAAPAAESGRSRRGVLANPHHPPRAKAVIYLFMAGGPSQLELFDSKPTLQKLSGQPTPAHGSGSHAASRQRSPIAQPRP